MSPGSRRNNFWRARFPHWSEKTNLKSGRSTGPSFRLYRGLFFLLSLLVVAGLFAGCSSNKKRGWSIRPRSSQEWLDQALGSEIPDERRAGVIGFAESCDGTSEWAAKVFDTIARTDSDAMVRCAALRAMFRVAGPDRVPTLLKILNSADSEVDGVRPAPGPVRWEAAKLLEYHVDQGRYDPEQIDLVVQALLGRLAKDSDRNVKLAVIETMAYFSRRPIPGALIDALQTDDYAVKHACERALITLTGVTHNHDAAAWRAWLAATDDPFKNAGQLSPDDLEPPKKRWWERGWDW